jgi:predicted transcriptional regulator
MSIKPKFGEEIAQGVKRYELRRLVGPLIQPGDEIFLYFTRPVSAVMCAFRAGLVFLSPVRSLRRLLAELGSVGIGEEDLKYVEGARYAMLIEVRDLRKCLTPVRLHDVWLRPPPSYVRLRQDAAARLSHACAGPAQRAA